MGFSGQKGSTVYISLTSFSEIALVLLKTILLKPNIGFGFVSKSRANFSKHAEKELCKR
jgi:hypothetical protein